MLLTHNAFAYVMLAKSIFVDTCVRAFSLF